MPGKLDSMVKYPRTLVEAVEAGLVIPFAGAGVSYSVQSRSGGQLIPAWPDLLRRAVNRLDEEMRAEDARLLRKLMAGNSDYGQVFSAAREILGPLWVKFLQEELNPPFAKARSDTLALPRAVWGLSSNFIVTTSYDQVLEWASPAPGLVRQADAFSVMNELPPLGEKLSHALIWHVYGALQERNAIFTFDGRRGEGSEVAEASRLEFTEKVLKTLFCGDHTIVFIGTGAPMSLSNQLFSGSKRMHYWLVQGGDAAAMQKQLDVRDVPIQAVGFPSHGALPSFIMELASQRKLVSEASRSGHYLPVPPEPAASSISSSLPPVSSSQTQVGPVPVSENLTLAIFVALDMEREVVVKHFGLKNQLPSNVWQGERNGLQIALFSSGEMGRVAGAIHTMRFLAKHRPKMLLVAGIAGGFRQEKVNLGDVIVAKSVADLASRKIRQNKTRPLPEFRPKEFVADQRLPDFLQSGSFDRAAWEHRIIEHGEWPSGLRPTLHVGTIASLDEVVSSDRWIASLQAAWPKLLGVEMEAGGVCAAAEEYRIRAAVIRGVSDAADPAKSDDSWRRRSMKAVVCTIDSLLENPVVFSMSA